MESWQGHLKYCPQKHSRRLAGPRTHCLIKAAWCFNTKARMAEKWASILLKTTHTSHFSGLIRISKETAYVFHLQTNSLYSFIFFCGHPLFILKAPKYSKCQLYWVCSHVLLLYMHTFKHVNIQMTIAILCFKNWIVLWCEFWCFFIKGCYACMDIHTNKMGLSFRKINLISQVHSP